MPKLAETREEILEQIEELYIMGFVKPRQVAELLEKQGTRISIDTVKAYTSIVLRRMRNRYKSISRERMMKKELQSLDYMENAAWISYRKAANTNERSGGLRTILQIKERRAKLLGFDTENLNVHVSKTLEDLLADSDYEEKQSQTDRGAVMDSGQAAEKGSLPFEPDSEAIGSE